MKNIFLFLPLFYLIQSLFSQNPEWINYHTGNSGLPTNYVSDIEIDLSNEIWFATHEGLVRFNNANWTIYDMTNTPLTSNFVRDITVDDSNNIWIGMGYWGAAWPSITV